MKTLSYGQHFLHYKSVGKCFIAKGQVNSKAIQPEIEHVRHFMPVLLTCQFDVDSIKDEAAILCTQYPHYKSTGPFGCHGNQSFDRSIFPKTLCSLSPNPVMLTFDKGWPTGLRDIQVWKYERRWGTDGGPFLYYMYQLTSDSCANNHQAGCMKSIAAYFLHYLFWGKPQTVQISNWFVMR